MIQRQVRSRTENIQNTAKIWLQKYNLHTHPTSGNKMLVVVNVRELAVQVKGVLMDRYSFYLAECFLNFLNFLQ